MNSAIVMHFKTRVRKVLGYFDLESSCRAITSAYTESWRGYHNTTHILGMLDALDMISEDELEVLERQIIALMVVYHDAWLKVRRNKGENELRSAEWAVRDLGSNAAPWLSDCVRQGILATATHSLDDVDPAYHKMVGILLDLDLRGIGMPYQAFQRDTEAIWKEFQPVYTRVEYDVGRAQWAASFLEHDRIYHTPHFAHLEEQARSNLRRLAGQ